MAARKSVSTFCIGSCKAMSASFFLNFLLPSHPHDAKHLTWMILGAHSLESLLLALLVLPVCAVLLLVLGLEVCALGVPGAAVHVSCLSKASKRFSKC